MIIIQPCVAMSARRRGEGQDATQRTLTHNKLKATLRYESQAQYPIRRLLVRRELR
jgi:hypothetical protein